MFTAFIELLIFCSFVKWVMGRFQKVASEDEEQDGQEEVWRGNTELVFRTQKGVRPRHIHSMREPAHIESERNQFYEAPNCGEYGYEYQDMLGDGFEDGPIGEGFEE